MLKITLELKEAWRYINNNTINTTYKELFFIETEFNSLSNLKDIFEIFVKLSIKLQGQLYTTLNQGLLYIY